MPPTPPIYPLTLRRSAQLAPPPSPTSCPTALLPSSTLLLAHPRIAYPLAYNHSAPARSELMTCCAPLFRFRSHYAPVRIPARQARSFSLLQPRARKGSSFQRSRDQ